MIQGLLLGGEEGRWFLRDQRSLALLRSRHAAFWDILPLIT
jgi:hypothetical protein